MDVFTVCANLEGEFIKPDNVTHWQPLPDKPKANSMSVFQRENDHTKEHYKLAKSEDGTQVYCTHCGKVVEEREGGFPDYSMFMGAVWIKQNLPCKPYDLENENL